MLSGISLKRSKMVEVTSLAGVIRYIVANEKLTAEVKLPVEASRKATGLWAAIRKYTEFETVFYYELSLLMHDSSFELSIKDYSKILGISLEKSEFIYSLSDGKSFEELLREMREKNSTTVSDFFIRHRHESVPQKLEEARIAVKSSIEDFTASKFDRHDPKYHILCELRDALLRTFNQKSEPDDSSFLRISSCAVCGKPNDGKSFELAKNKHGILYPKCSEHKGEEPDGEILAIIYYNYAMFLENAFNRIEEVYER